MPWTELKTAVSPVRLWPPAPHFCLALHVFVFKVHLHTLPSPPQCCFPIGSVISGPSGRSPGDRPQVRPHKEHGWDRRIRRLHVCVDDFEAGLPD
jgi:hypothetical protein